MSDHPIRLFDSAAAIRRVGEGLLACTLPAIIRRYNEAVGGTNSDTAGYHETLTQLYVIGVQRFAERCPADELLSVVNALLASEMAQRSWPLRFYSLGLLFSVAARRGWAEPDLAPISLGSPPPQA